MRLRLGFFSIFLLYPKHLHLDWERFGRSSYRVRTHACTYGCDMMWMTAAQSDASICIVYLPTGLCWSGLSVECAPRYLPSIVVLEGRCNIDRGQSVDLPLVVRSCARGCMWYRGGGIGS